METFSMRFFGPLRLAFAALFIVACLCSYQAVATELFVKKKQTTAEKLQADKAAREQRQQQPTLQDLPLLQNNSPVIVPGGPGPMVNANPQTNLPVIDMKPFPDDKNCTQEDAANLRKIDSAGKALKGDPTGKIPSGEEKQWIAFFSNPQSKPYMNDLYTRCMNVAYQERVKDLYKILPYMQKLPAR